MTTSAPILCLVRRDLRLDDNPVLAAASQSGRPVIPVFVLDAQGHSLGAAAKWRLGKGLECFAETLERVGSALILRSGEVGPCVRALIRETGACAVYWSRAYDADGIARDTALKSDLRAEGIEAVSFPGALLWEPWTIKTKQGADFRVYSAFWRAARQVDPGPPSASPHRLCPPAHWPASEDIAQWQMGRAMGPGADVVAGFANIGERRALERLSHFQEHRIASYGQGRDFLNINATSELSENLALGEISPRRCWAAGMAALQQGAPGAEVFLKELAWREFAWHLMYHAPHITTHCWRAPWSSFPWNTDGNDRRVIDWQRGRCGVAVVDAAMRELYVTGRMHNRARMIVASYLTKNLGFDWRIGQRWFGETLIDWDAASNAMGWQWVAGSGPDAAPYFRVFNPQTQADKFDPDGAYRARWLAEGQPNPPQTALAFYRAAPAQWRLSPSDPPARLADGALAQSRRDALERYQAWKA